MGMTVLTFEEVERDGKKLYRGWEGKRMIKGGALFNSAWDCEKYYIWCMQGEHSPFSFERPL
jgi:hypothetical protein